MIVTIPLGNNYCLQKRQRKISDEEYRQDIHNARYEGAIRSDFSTPKVSKYETIECVILKLTEPL